MNTILETCSNFLDEYVPQWLAKDTKEPLVIYISGPQGSGKSYNGKQLHEYLAKNYSDKTIVFVSIDDFYLTHEDQLAINHQYKNNKLFQGRGLPGTHDMSLLSDTLQEIIANKKGNYAYLPQYDKSKFNGEGDRCEEFFKVALPIDIFIIEGWFFGFEPILQDISSTGSENQLKGDMIDTNAKLFMYSDLMWNNPEIHSLGIVLATDEIENVYNWRTEQEHETRLLKGSGMTDDQVVHFVDRYMPCYKVYYDKLCHEESLGSIATLTIGIDKNRSVYSSKVRCIE